MIDWCCFQYLEFPFFCLFKNTWFISSASSIWGLTFLIFDSLVWLPVYEVHSFWFLIHWCCFLIFRIPLAFWVLVTWAMFSAELDRGCGMAGVSHFVWYVRSGKRAHTDAMCLSETRLRISFHKRNWKVKHIIPWPQAARKDCNLLAIWSGAVGLSLPLYSFFLSKLVLQSNAAAPCKLLSIEGEENRWIVREDLKLLKEGMSMPFKN